MKYFIVVIILFHQLDFCQAQNNFSIKGQANIFKDGTEISISVFYPYNSFYFYSKIKDSTLIKNGEFELHINNTNTELYNISIKNSDGIEVATKTVFFDPMNTYIILKDTQLNDIEFNGNASANDFISFGKKLEKIKPPPIYFELFKKYDSLINKDLSLAKKVFLRIDSILRILDMQNGLIANEWLNSHPNSILNSYIIYNFLKSKMIEDSVERKYVDLPLKAKNNSWGKEMGHIVDYTFVGKKAPSFILSDTSDVKHALSDYIGKGQYVLLDFWAAWCEPCRINNPDLKKVYDEFKHKNFEIVGISFDKSKSAWIDAIKNDNLFWPQLSSLNDGGLEIAKKYSVMSIPFSLLLDPQGIIIAKNLNSGELKKLLLELNLNKKIINY